MPITGKACEGMQRSGRAKRAGGNENASRRRGKSSSPVRGRRARPGEGVGGRDAREMRRPRRSPLGAGGVSEGKQQPRPLQSSAPSRSSVAGCSHCPYISIPKWLHAPSGGTLALPTPTSAATHPTSRAVATRLQKPSAPQKAGAIQSTAGLAHPCERRRCCFPSACLPASWAHCLCLLQKLAGTPQPQHVRGADHVGAPASRKCKGSKTCCVSTKMKLVPLLIAVLSPFCTHIYILHSLTALAHKHF